MTARFARAEPAPVRSLAEVRAAACGVLLKYFGDARPGRR